jgi:shikimate kinase
MSDVAKPANIFLTGLMGTGKSTIGALVADELSYRFVDTDEEIMTNERLSITEIFRTHGEAHFRRAERTLLEKLVKREMQVIATGGGMLADEANLALAIRHGLVVLLIADTKSLALRLRASVDRPLIAGVELEQRIDELRARRAGVFDRIPVQIDTTRQSPAQTAALVAERYHEWIKQ